ncbi:laccase from botrytis Aclada At 1.67 A resolution [Leptodontidium sp. MPI-SDFR-AT-0119]|nr:laccase from botrytis Aclada At 1.67 A resolution [Leptodontidium sp. MPI-SDFR-AT-0119]
MSSLPSLITFLPLVSASYASVTGSTTTSLAIKDILVPKYLNCLSGCMNGPRNRNQWGSYSIDTNWYEITPNTGRTREYWLEINNVTIAPDGYERVGLVVNGTYPGPTLTADWGDHVIVHVTNKLKDNDTAIHFHGLNQRNTNSADGVPGVTQCPISPGGTYTHMFRAEQYGTTWYHSHLSTQYGDGVLGAFIINGPATANYDVDLGPIIISDWYHQTAAQLWETSGKYGSPIPDNGIINGHNIYNCAGSSDPACVGSGKRWETTFQRGKKHRLRIINTAADGYMRFSIDGHKLLVIANDLVPIVPYLSDSIMIGIGQRYDVIVEANSTPGNYWMRATGQQTCKVNPYWNNTLAIVRYDHRSTTVPTTTGTAYPSQCGDEPSASLVPHLPLNVGDASVEDIETLNRHWTGIFTWLMGGAGFWLDWANPTNLAIVQNTTLQWPPTYQVHPVPQVNEWVYFILQDISTLGITHPVHLHGHDSFVIGLGTDIFNASTTPVNLKNPPRRDTASLPGNGWLGLAFKTDNPGSWILHCHIAWHASQGFAVQFLERQNEIKPLLHGEERNLLDTCAAWANHISLNLKDDSGI